MLNRDALGFEFTAWARSTHVSFCAGVSLTLANNHVKTCQAMRYVGKPLILFYLLLP